MFQKTRDHWRRADPLKWIAAVLVVSLIVAQVQDFLDDRQDAATNEDINRRANLLVEANKCDQIKDQIELLADARENDIEEDIAVLLVESGELRREGITPEEELISRQKIQDALQGLATRQPFEEFQKDLSHLQEFLDRQCPTIEDVIRESEQGSVQIDGLSGEGRAILARAIGE